MVCLISFPDQEKNKIFASFAPWWFNLKIALIHKSIGDLISLISFFAAKKMGYRFNDVAETLGIHPVTAGKCAEKGKKLVDNDDGIWDVLDKRS